MKSRKRVSGSKPRLEKAKLPYKKRLTLGVARVEKDLAWLMDNFQELLLEMGEGEI